MHGGDAAVLPVRPRVRRDEQRARKRDQLDREGNDHDSAESRGCSPAQHERCQVRSEGEDEERKEERAERSAVRAAAVRRHERRGLDPGAGDATRHEQCDRTRSEQGGAGQGSSGSVDAGGAGSDVAGGVASVAGGGGGVVCFGGGLDAGGASGTDSVGSVVVVSVVVAGGV